MKNFMSAIDFYDVICFLGLVSLAVGLWMIYPALMFVLVGILLIVLGLLGAGILQPASRK